MIRSTFAGFTTAQLAMSASQRALDVTGQNIANINTRGYSKQRLEISSLNNRRRKVFYSFKEWRKSRIWCRSYRDLPAQRSVFGRSVPQPDE